MLKSVLDFGKQAISLTRDVQQNKADIADIREELKLFRLDLNELREDVIELSRTVELLSLQLQHDRQDAAREREMQQLRLENILLRFDRGLPPGSTETDK